MNLGKIGKIVDQLVHFRVDFSSYKRRTASGPRMRPDQGPHTVVQPKWSFLENKDNLLIARNR